MKRFVLVLWLLLLSGTVFGEPPKPTGLKVTVGERAVELEWNAVTDPGVDYFIVFYGTKHAEYDSQKQAQENRIKVEGLENGTTYFFAVLSVDLNQNFSEFSEEVFATPGRTVKPPAPIGLRAGQERETAVIEWIEPSPKPAKYIVFRKESGEKEFREIGQTKGNFWYDENIQKGFSYQYVAVSVDQQDNKSGYSNVALLEVPLTSEKCTPEKDGVCDTDCERKEDPDCFCNKNGTCEEGIENQENCPEDCLKEEEKFFGQLDYVAGAGLLIASILLMIYFLEKQ